MKTAEEIIKHVQENEDTPTSYSQCETTLWITIKRILLMYYNKLIKKEQANRLKNKAVNDYNVMSYYQKMWMDNLEKIRKAEEPLIRLRKKEGNILETLYEIVEIFTEEKFER